MSKYDEAIEIATRMLFAFATHTVDKKPIYPTLLLCKEALQQAKEYKLLEEQGLLLKLPCKIGDVVYYVHSKKKIISCNVISFAKTNHSFNVYLNGTLLEENATYYIDDWFSVEVSFNKSIFLTREEAEQKLKELNGGLANE